MVKEFVRGVGLRTKRNAVPEAIKSGGLDDINREDRKHKAMIMAIGNRYRSRT